MSGRSIPVERPSDALGGLGVLAAQQLEVAPGLRHLELYTARGLLTLLWHGDPTAQAVLLTGGGALGGLLGPGGGLYHHLGVALAARGIGTVRVGYRAPGRLPLCVHDMAAAAELALSSGATRLVALGHSFGGAVVLGLAAALPEAVRGVATLATQSGGCETAAELGRRPLLLIHGDRDQILPLSCSESVRALAGHGELVVLPGAGHLFEGRGDELRGLLLDWIPATLASPGEASSDAGEGSAT